MTAAVAFQRNGARAVVSAPEWLPDGFDPTGSMLSFYWVPLEERRRLSFLRSDCFDGRFEQTTVRADEIAAELTGVPTVPLHFVFHSAFCGSTLLVNALAALDGCVGLKEPAVITNLAHRLSCGENFERTGRMELVLRLLARPWEDTRAVVAKPSCFATPALSAIMQSAPFARAVLLFSDLRTFLLSVAKRGLPGHGWGRQAFVSCLRHNLIHLRYTLPELLEHTDLQAAGLAWLMRTDYLRRTAAQLGSGRAMLIDIADFLSNPRQALGEVAQFLKIGADENAVAKVVSGDTFARHSKEGRGFDADRRQAELEAARSAYGEEVEAVARWIEKVAAAHGIG